MKQYKIYVKDEETNVKVQLHGFKHGYRWGQSGGEPPHTNAPFLYFEEDGNIAFDSDSFFGDFKMHYDYKELTPEEFLAIEPPVKNKLIKDPVSLMQQLIDDGYEVDSKGFWYGDSVDFFPGMWQYCGTGPELNDYAWLDEWLDEVGE